MIEDQHLITRDQAREKNYQRRERQQFAGILILFMVIAVMIGALYLVQATTNVSNARDIELLRVQRQRLERENELLRAENASLNRLDYLEQRAFEMGFRRATTADMQYLRIEGYHYDQIPPTPTPTPIVATPQAYEDNFAGYLQRQFDELQAQFDSWASDDE